ncbi:HAD domain-containing protein [Vibrio sp. D431a]|uniref:HAD domain-containing protein n=1 Tax=Vibrio sp. D431a TaxID=2837388 RepID=UPI002556102D|nr:HAD domain-containing protein [Vibrio sp. D431a]MDK9789827.1 hypothetical protein [Vibrio sp. D431a]
MAFFDVFGSYFNGKNHIELIKVKRQDPLGRKKAAKGMHFLGRIEAPTPKVGERVAQARIESGIMGMIAPTHTEKNVGIFVDINGVLDDYSGWTKLMAMPNQNSMSDLERLGVVVSADKLAKLASLALKYNASLICTSEWRIRGITISDLIGELADPVGTESEAYLYKLIADRDILEFTYKTPYERTCKTSRSDEIFEYIESEKISHCLVLEDSHPIPKSLNPVFTSEHNGLTSSHFSKIEGLLKSFESI